MAADLLFPLAEDIDAPAAPLRVAEAAAPLLTEAQAHQALIEVRLEGAAIADACLLRLRPILLLMEPDERARYQRQIADLLAIARDIPDLD